MIPFVVVVSLGGAVAATAVYFSLLGYLAGALVTSRISPSETALRLLGAARQGICELELSTTHVKVRSGTLLTACEWKDIQRIDFVDEYILLVAAGEHAFIVPGNAFDLLDKRQAFLAEVRSRIPTQEP
ncbi:MAG: YcxB family protein [Panacagrimonas sp.]